jgi:hypothetical protein
LAGRSRHDWEVGGAAERQIQAGGKLEEPDCADCPDYDDCTNPLICIATVEDY